MIVALPFVFALGMLTGSFLGIRGYKRRQLAQLIARLAAQAPASAPIGLYRVSGDAPVILNPLTGTDMAASAGMVA